MARRAAGTDIPVVVAYNARSLRPSANASITRSAGERPASSSRRSFNNRSATDDFRTVDVCHGSRTRTSPWSVAGRSGVRLSSRPGRSSRDRLAHGCCNDASGRKRCVCSMRFVLYDLELSEPLQALHVPPDHDGLAVVGRLHGTPVGFAMRPTPAGTTLDAAALAAWLGAEMAAGVLEAALRKELAPAAPSDPVAPSLTVAVCTRDRPERLRRCLESVRGAIGGVSPAPDVLVIDNASADARTADVAAALGVRCVREPTTGLDVARNRAVAEARGDWLAFIDDDAV